MFASASKRGFISGRSFRSPVVEDGIFSGIRSGLGPRTTVRTPYVYSTRDKPPSSLHLFEVFVCFTRWIKSVYIVCVFYNVCVEK